MLHSPDGVTVEKEGRGVGDEPSPGELSRQFARLSSEISGLHQALDRLVRVDLYEAHRTAMNADMRRMERDVDDLRKEKIEQDKQRAIDQAANRRVVWAAALAMVGNIIASVVVVVILA